MKTTGSIAIILFSLLTGLTVLEYKKKQIRYIDDLIYLGRRIELLLSSTVPETDIIFKKLESEERLKKYKIKEIYEMSPLNSQLNLKIAEYISIIGKYDIDTQLKCTDEFTGYFLNLKEQYTEYYNSHCRLYIAISLSLGMSVVVLFV